MDPDKYLKEYLKPSAGAVAAGESNRGEVAGSLSLAERYFQSRDPAGDLEDIPVAGLTGDELLGLAYVAGVESGRDATAGELSRAIREKTGRLRQCEQLLAARDQVIAEQERRLDRLRRLWVYRLYRTLRRPFGRRSG